MPPPRNLSRLTRMCTHARRSSRRFASKHYSDPRWKWLRVKVLALVSIDRLKYYSPNMNPNRRQDLRIKSVSVSHFRGISHGTLTLTSDNGCAVSALLLGDNGSGKSSLLEAIDYSLTGRAPRLVEVNQAIRIDPRSHLATEKEEMVASVLLRPGEEPSR